MNEYRIGQELARLVTAKRVHTKGPRRQRQYVSGRAPTVAVTRTRRSGYPRPLEVRYADLFTDG